MLPCSTLSSLHPHPARLPCPADDPAIACHLAIALQTLAYTWFLENKPQLGSSPAGLAAPSSHPLLAAAIRSACSALRRWQQRQRAIWAGSAEQAVSIRLDTATWPPVQPDTRLPVVDWVHHPASRALHDLSKQTPGGSGSGSGATCSEPATQPAPAAAKAVLLLGHLAGQVQQAEESRAGERGGGAPVSVPAWGAAAGLLVECLALSLAKLVRCDALASSSLSQTLGDDVAVSIRNFTPHSADAVPLLLSVAVGPLCR